MRRVGWFILAGMFSFFSSKGQNIVFEQYDLPNGLHVILQQDNSLPIVSVGLMLRYPDGRSSNSARATLLERILTTSTSHMKPGDFQNYLLLNGGKYAFNAEEDYCFFSQTFSSDMVGLALWLEAEMLGGLKADSLLFETVRMDIFNRINEPSRLHSSLQKDIVLDAFFPSGVDRLDAWSVVTADLKQLQRFYRRTFSVKNAVLVVVGSFDRKKVRDYIEAYFAPLNASGRVSSSAKDDTLPDTLSIEASLPPFEESPEYSYEESLPRRDIDTVRYSGKKPQAIFAWQAAGVGSDDFDSFLLLNNILFNGKRSRLYRTLVDELGWAEDVEPYFLSRPGKSVFGVRVTLKEGTDVERVRKKMIDAAALLQNEYVEGRELTMAKNTFEVSDLTENYSSRAAIARMMAYYHLFFKDTGLINTRMKGVAAVTRDDLVLVARKYLGAEGLKTIYFSPSGE